MKCQACSDRKKDWVGDDPICAFPDGEAFTARNWNCATVGRVRALAEGKFPIIRNEEQNSVLIPIEYDPSVEDSSVEKPSHRHAVWLYVGWYKNRGKTEALHLIYDSPYTRVPTEEEVLDILEMHGG